MANRNAAKNLSSEARSRGGRNSPGNFKNRPEEELREIARKGGEMSPGNFKNNPARAAEAGRKSRAGKKESTKRKETA